MKNGTDFVRDMDWFRHQTVSIRSKCSSFRDSSSGMPHSGYLKHQPIKIINHTTVRRAHVYIVGHSRTEREKSNRDIKHPLVSRINFASINFENFEKFEHRSWIASEVCQARKSIRATMFKFGIRHNFQPLLIRPPHNFIISNFRER